MGTEAIAIDVPSVFRCALTIFAFKMALSLRGYGWTLGCIRRRVATVPKGTRVNCDVVKAAERAVAVA
jgi:hypothetical protein